MLELTQEILERMDPLLDASDAETAAKLLLTVDRTSLCALMIHVLQERGVQAADALGTAYLRQRNAA